MNILITGVHSFVGLSLVKSLSERHTVYGLDTVYPYAKGVKMTLSWKDLDSFYQPFTFNQLEIAKLLQHIDIILHLTEKAENSKNRSHSREYFDINTKLTQKIFNFFLKSNAKKFFFFSSVKAAADTVAGGVLTEDIIPAPKGPYGESKIEAENYIFSLKEEWEDQKRVYILRPCMIHGPGNKGNLNLLYNVVRRGIPWPLGDFENKRTFTSIDNLCYVIEGGISRDIASGIYHMADDEALSTNELISIICHTIGKKTHIWKINKSFMTGCAKVGSVLHLPLNADRLQKLTENYVVSNAKIKQALGIDRMPVRAKEGLEKTIQSFKQSR